MISIKVSLVEVLLPGSWCGEVWKLWRGEGEAECECCGATGAGDVEADGASAAGVVLVVTVNT